MYKKISVLTDKLKSHKNSLAVLNTDVPSLSDVPSASDVPSLGDVPSVNDVPSLSDVPSLGDVPSASDVPSANAVPGSRETELMKKLADIENANKQLQTKLDIANTTKPPSVSTKSVRSYEGGPVSGLSINDDGDITMVYMNNTPEIHESEADGTVQQILVKNDDYVNQGSHVMILTTSDGQHIVKSKEYIKIHEIKIDMGATVKKGDILFTYILSNNIIVNPNPSS